MKDDDFIAEITGSTVVRDVKMNKAFITDVWIPALRSGEYQQVKGSLRGFANNEVNVGMCCLGVACDLIIKEKLMDGIRWNWSEDMERWFVVTTPPSGEEIDVNVPDLDYVDERYANLDVMPRPVAEFIGTVQNGRIDTSKIPVRELHEAIGLEFDDSSEHSPALRYGTALSELNDSGRTFEQIADVIELAIKYDAFDKRMFETF